LSGCDPSIDTIALDGETGAPHHRGPPMSLDEAAGAVVATKGGAIVALDPDTFEELFMVDEREPEGRVDVAGALGEPGALVILRFDEDEYGAEISRFEGEASPGVLGTYSGAFTAVPLPFGTLVAESEIGDRLRVTPLGGGFNASVPCPRPTSFRIVEQAPAGAVVEALAFVDGALVSLTIRADDGGARSCEGTTLEVPGTEDARLFDLASPATRAVADVKDGELVVTPLDGPRAGGAARFACPGARLEHVVSIPEPSGETLVVALVSGPAHLIVARVAPGGGMALSAGRFETVKLDGEPMRADRGPSHALVVVGRRVLVATAAGVAAFDLAADGVPSAVAVPGGLMGPLAVIAR
jgi:hypothetical protein